MIACGAPVDAIPIRNAYLQTDSPSKTWSVPFAVTRYRALMPHVFL